MTFILIIIGFVLFLDYLRLRERVEKLEQRERGSVVVKETAQVKLSPIPPPVSNSTISPFPAPAQVVHETFTPAVVSVKAVETKEEPEAELFLFTWFKEHTLIKIGGLFFFLGAAWFVSYAINAGWLSPEIRITFGFLLAVSAYVLGVLKAKIVPTQYLVLTALGTGIMGATVSAAQMVFSIFHPLFALGILAVSIGYTIYVAFMTQTKWLVLAAGTAGLLAPMLVGGNLESLWILLYLFVLSGGLLMIGFYLDSRPLTLLMVLGVAIYESALFSVATPNLLWFFVVLFSGMFFTAVTYALMRSMKPEVLDIFTLLIVGIVFVFFASEISLSDSLATFIATFIIGGTGYVLTERKAPISIVSVYIAFASAGLLIATSFLFSGFTLTLAYAVEITAAFFIMTYLGLPERVIWVGVAAYLLPIIGSINSFNSIKWHSGIWHVDALVLYTVTLSLFASAFWLLHKQSVLVYKWSSSAAAIFGVVSFFYTYTVISVVTNSLYAPIEAHATMYVLWATLSLLYVYYSLRRNLPCIVLKYSALSLSLPVIASLPSFTSPAWRLGVVHSDGLGVFAMIVVLVLTTLLLTQQFCKEYNGQLRSLIAGFVVVDVAYVFITFYVIWHGLLEPESLAIIATYMSYAFVLYGLTSLFVLVRASMNWISWSLSALLIPILLSLNSFSFTGWEGDALAPEAVGLFGLIVFFVMLAIGLRHRYAGVNPAALEQIKQWSVILFGLALLYAVGLTWSLAHTLAPEEQAISLALFIYTIAGLLAYQYGKRTEKQEYRYAGISLLSLVVIRLVVVDIWAMALIWKVVTFLGIGVLFIGTALLEKSPKDSSVE